MDIEQKQVELTEHFVKQALTLNNSALTDVIVEETFYPSLFSFSEILSLPKVLQLMEYWRFVSHNSAGFRVALILLEGTNNLVYLDLLKLFDNGTWSDYKRAFKKALISPILVRVGVLPYDLLIQELDVTNVHDLEDFLINEIITGVNSPQYPAGISILDVVGHSLPIVGQA